MSAKKPASDETLFDTRVVSHRMRRGQLTAEQLQKHLDALPDDASEAAETTTRFVTPFSEKQA